MEEEESAMVTFADADEVRSLRPRTHQQNARNVNEQIAHRPFSSRSKNSASQRTTPIMSLLS